jgi:prepilin-type processing-associated H-X9-DG protein
MVLRPPHSKRFPVAKAFTLIELLVVIATLAIFSLLLLPALASARPNNQSRQCLNNVRQLTIAWATYASDYSERLVAANNWTGGGYMDWSVASFNTNTAMLLDPSQSLIAGYVKSAAIFKCPADKFLAPVQYALGWKERARSYSMNGGVGGVSLIIGPQPHYPLGRVYPTVGARKMSDLSTPGPAQVFVLLDEHPDSINDGVFLFIAGYTPALYAWRDAPASYHDGACNLSFADGHCAARRWEDLRTIKPVRLIRKWWYTGSTYPVPGSSDYTWMSDRVPYSLD